MLLLVRLLGLLGANIAAKQVRRLRAMPLTAPRILLVRPDHLGDLVMTTPILDALKEALPEAQLTMMVGPWSSEIVARHPALERLITCAFPGFRRAAQGPLAPYILLLQTAQQLQRGEYDLAINLRPDFWWGAALLYLARIPRRVGYAIKPATPFLTHALAFRTPEHATVSSLRLVSAALEIVGHEPLTEPYTPASYPLHFVPTREEQRTMTQRLEQAGITEHTPLVVIHPGTGAAVKLWRAEGWATCANHLVNVVGTDSSRPGWEMNGRDESVPTSAARIILTGSKQERPLLDEIARTMTTPPLLMTDMSVGQLAALLARARLVMGVDSGPLHLAVAQHVPTIHIFGPTDACIFGPWGEAQQHIVIASTQRCPGCPAIPCGRLDFTAAEVASHPCVRLVPEEAVEQAMTKLLDIARTIPNR